MDKIHALMRTRNHFVICGHINPDGDAIGACYGLALALTKMGKHAQVVLEPYASRFDIIPGRCLLYDGALDALGVDVLFCLDCSDPARLGAAEVLLAKTENTICIDHHISNKGFARHNYVNHHASSTCELVYTLICHITDIDCEIASALYAGLVTDTGGFRFNATSRETLEIAGQLIATGIPFSEIYTDTLHRHSLTEAKIFGKVLDICACTAGGRVVSACVTRAMFDELHASEKDLEGVVEYLLNTRGAEVSVLLYEKTQTEIKVSLRAHRVNVERIASRLGGGGHMLAAGANTLGEIYTIRDTVLALLEQELDSHA